MTAGSNPDQAPEERVMLLRLHLDGNGRPAGTVQDETGAPVPFVGWLALMTQLTEALPHALRDSCSE